MPEISLCPLPGFAWKPVDKMPDNRLPRHIQVLVTLLANPQKLSDAETILYDRGEAENYVKASGLCPHIRNVANEIDTICRNGYAEKVDLGMLRIHAKRSRRKLLTFVTEVTH